MQDKKTPAEEAKEKKRRSNGRAGLSRQDIIYGLRLGASEHSYLIKNGQIDVLKNVMGGVQVSESSEIVGTSFLILTFQKLGAICTIPV